MSAGPLKVSPGIQCMCHRNPHHHPLACAHVLECGEVCFNQGWVEQSNHGTEKGAAENVGLGQWE